jgi:hypothetical protein
MNHNWYHKIIILLLLCVPLLSSASLLSPIGITNLNLNKIAVDTARIDLPDSDGDGLGDRLELALGTNPQKKDSDGDGYDDKVEIVNSYNPNGPGRQKIDLKLSQKLSGQYLLQIENHGYLWYVDPQTYKRVLISPQVIAPPQPPTPKATSSRAQSADQALGDAVQAIRAKNFSLASLSFTPDLRASVVYSLGQLDAEGLFSFAGILAAAKLNQDGATEKTYTSEVYFELGQKNNQVKITVTKQADGFWLISKL